MRLSKDQELAQLFKLAIERCWISGRPPAKDTICVRVTRADARRVIRALGQRKESDDDKR